MKSKANFCDYLRELLIPDLRASGSNATADDFQTALDFLQPEGPRRDWAIVAIHKGQNFSLYGPLESYEHARQQLPSVEAQLPQGSRAVIRALN